MKKFLILIVIIIVISLTGCNNISQVENNNLKIVTSFYPMYIATLNIVDGAKDVTLTNLTSTEVGCLHDYQLTTANLMTIEKSDILIINGGGMENFIQKVVDNCPNISIINSSDGILEEHEEEENHTHEENAHIWVSISLYEKQVENICNSLSTLDEKNAELYKENTQNYLKRLDDLKEEMHKKLDNISSENKNIVTFHEAFEFFAEEFNLNVVAVIEREPGTYPSAGELAQTIDIINNTDARAIFVEPQYSKTAADTISKETNVPIYTLDPVVSGMFEKDAYEKIMRENLINLVDALEE